MTFRVGQKVVCVDDKPTSGLVWTGDKPKLKAVYTVTSICPGHYGNYQSVTLAEIKNSPLGYRASRFRPVVERKTDISIFTAMLNPSKVEA